MIENLYQMAMRSAGGVISEYHYILENASKSDIVLTLDTKRMLEIKQMFNSGKFMDEQEAKRLEKEYYQLCSYQKPRSNMNEEGLLLSGVKGFGVGTALPMINCINKDDI